MVNTCEPVQGSSSVSKLKWLTSLDQKVMGAGVGADGRQLVVGMLLGLFAGAYGRTTPEAETSKPRILASLRRPIFPPSRSGVPPRHEARIVPAGGGKLIASEAQGGAGVGSWRKRMPSCNGADTGSEFARRESEQTSGRCLFAR